MGVRKLSMPTWKVQIRFLAAYEDPEADLEGLMKAWNLDWKQVMRWKNSGSKFGAKLEAARRRVKERTVMEAERAAALGARGMVNRAKQLLEDEAAVKTAREEAEKKVEGHMAGENEEEFKIQNSKFKVAEGEAMRRERKGVEEFTQRMVKGWEKKGEVDLIGEEEREIPVADVEALGKVGKGEC